MPSYFELIDMLVFFLTKIVRSCQLSTMKLLLQVWFQREQMSHLIVFGCSSGPTWVGLKLEIIIFKWYI
jgi:hypothetical protein